MVQKADVVTIIKEVSSSVRVGDTDHGKPLKEIGVDSLDLSGILLEIEEKFSIKIPDQDIARLETIDMIVEYLREKTGGR
jgi:acyl carrier protein